MNEMKTIRAMEANEQQGALNINREKIGREGAYGRGGEGREGRERGEPTKLSRLCAAHRQTPKEASTEVLTAPHKYERKLGVSGAQGGDLSRYHH
jgi:hypothetical protein